MEKSKGVKPFIKYKKKIFIGILRSKWLISGRFSGKEKRIISPFSMANDDKFTVGI